MAKPIKFYFDLMSQPSRALYILLELSKIPHEKVEVAIRKGEHLTENFRQINRFQKLPSIQDNNFNLSESVAILHYLDSKKEYPGLKTLYPENVQEKALVNEYLEWQHLNTRQNCAFYFLYHWLFPMLNGKAPEERKSIEIKNRMEKTLDDFENIWLKENKFLTGNKITAADIWAACELEQPKIVGYDITKGRPKLKAWLDTVRQETNPIYDVAHKKAHFATKLLPFVNGMAGYETFQGRPKLETWWNEVKKQTNPVYDEAHKVVYRVISQYKGNVKPKL